MYYYIIYINYLFILQCFVYMYYMYVYSITNRWVHLHHLMMCLRAVSCLVIAREYLIKHQQRIFPSSIKI